MTDETFETDKINTQYPGLLNALSEMQESPAYVGGWSVLAEAERVIVALEKQLQDQTKLYDQCIAIKDAKAECIEKFEAEVKATREFAIRSVLISYCGKQLTPDLLYELVKDITEEINNGPCSWAFDPTTKDDDER